MPVQLPSRIMFPILSGELNDAIQADIIIISRYYDAAAIKLKNARNAGLKTDNLTMEVPLEEFIGLCEIFDAMQRELMITGGIWKDINDMVKKGNDTLMTMRGTKNSEEKE